MGAMEPERAKKGTEVQTHVVMEGLGFTRVFTCVSSLWSSTVQVPKNTKTHREAL